ncbi:MAG: riboflavin synthase [Verrucomicrobiales bacterium]
MFTGIIELTARVAHLTPAEGGGAPQYLLARDRSRSAAVGESIAINGCCLTAESIDCTSGEIGFDLLGETLRCTNLGDLQPGAAVNVERALRAADRLSGHFVQGHVDCPSEVLSLTARGEDHRLEIALPAEFARYAVYKGSVAVDGISLTVAEANGGSIAIWLIPHTWAVTNLNQRRPGDRVNLEFDILSKYVAAMLDRMRS